MKRLHLQAESTKRPEANEVEEVRLKPLRRQPDRAGEGALEIVSRLHQRHGVEQRPILVPPQAAMLGTGAIVKRPRVIVDEMGNESIGVRSICYLPLTYDHRLIDGADAGRFLTTVKRRLEEGAFEADLGL